jgi:hypothetical protein
MISESPFLRANSRGVSGRANWRRVAAEGCIAATVFAAACVIGTVSLRSFLRTGGKLEFYQVEFGPSVLVACHRPYANAAAELLEPLNAFLHGQADRFDCALLPPKAPVYGSLGAYHRTARYLLWAVGLLWRMTGVDWNAVPLLIAALFGATSVMAYGIARLGMGRVLAIGVATATTVSTFNQSMMPFLRDYAKAPFILAAILVMGCIVKWGTTRVRLLGLAALGGMTVGLGLGFRNDILLVIPPLLFTVIALAPRGTRAVITRFAACLVFAATFVVTALPVLADYAGGTNTGHVSVLGLTAPFDEQLGVAPPIYEYGHFYSDTLAAAMISTYADRMRPQPGGVAYLSPEYDRAAFGYLGSVARYFPADLVVRAYAAIFTLPPYFFDQYQYPPNNLNGPKAVRLYRYRAQIDERLIPLARWAVLLAIFLIALRSVRWAVLALLVPLFFMGGTAIQFQPRHFFYLEFIPWWAFGFLAQVLASGSRAIGERSFWRWFMGIDERNTPETNPPATPAVESVDRIARPVDEDPWASRVSIRPVRAAVVFIAVASVGAWALLAAARTYQRRAAVRYFERIDAAPTTPLALTAVRTSSNRLLLAPTDRAVAISPRPLAFSYQYILVDLDPSRCEPAAAHLRAVYDASVRTVDLSQNLETPSGGARPGRIRFAYAVYERQPDIRFAGVEVAATAASCITVSHIIDASMFPLLPTVALGDDWRHGSLFQTIAHR